MGMGQRRNVRCVERLGSSTALFKVHSFAWFSMGVCDGAHGVIEMKNSMGCYGSKRASSSDQFIMIQTSSMDIVSNFVQCPA
jgi:hypothetical protein